MGPTTSSRPSEPTADWRDDAICTQVDPELFFPHVRGVANMAMGVCDNCPVARICLEYAYETRQKYGIWGGVHIDGARMTRTAYHARIKVLQGR